MEGSGRGPASERSETSRRGAGVGPRAPAKDRGRTKRSASAGLEPSRANKKRSSHKIFTMEDMEDMKGRRRTKRLASVGLEQTRANKTGTNQPCALGAGLVRSGLFQAAGPRAEGGLARPRRQADTGVPSCPSRYSSMAFMISMVNLFPLDYDKRQC